MFNNIVSNKDKIVVGLGTCGISSGADKIYDELKSKVNNIDILPVGCIGVCKYEPIVEIYKDDVRTTYVNVTLEKLDKIISSHINNNIVVKEYLIDENTSNILDYPFLKKQTRIALRNCGNINPEDINDYINHGGYSALKQVLTMNKDEVINILKESKLRGRGGAGFSAGLKWEFAKKEESDKKYVCCNADEGDPGAFMDRSLLEGDPHSVIEAMIIAAYTIGSNEGYIYVRAEYPVAVNRLNVAIKQARELNLLGNNILGTNFSFDLDLRLGSGAFVCGEETALINSIEGKRGEPNLKPPFPASRGLFNKPTLINNVETYANIPYILSGNKDKFVSIGSEKSKGTKVFALGGKINNTGLIEIPIGTSLKEILFDICEGIPNKKEFKAAQTGGPSGGCIPKEHLDISMDYESLASIGSMMGSGGLIVMDEDNCMVNIAEFFLNFTVDESCGKCVPCRVGTKRLEELLNKITNGKGTLEDLDKLEELSNHIKESSLCGLGQSAPNPVLSTLKYFKDEYLEHIENKKCKSKSCTNLLEYKILKDKCIGCTMCKRNCPVNAISGEVKQPHMIDQSICTKCGTCMEVCRFNSIVRE